MNTQHGPQAIHEHGQSLTELALLLPVLLLVILGSLDLARVYDSYVSITNAAREGARYASTRPLATASQVAVRVNQELTGTGITNVTVATPVCTSYASSGTIDCSSAVRGDYIAISVSVPFRFVTLFAVDQAHSLMTLQNTATMAIVLQ